MTKKITVTVVPASGKSREVEVEATATTVGEALKAAGVNANNAQISVNGNPATMDTALKQGAKVTLTEKARGS